MSREKKSAGPTSRHAAIRGRGALALAVPGGQAFQVFVGVLDHDDRRVDHCADGNRDAAQAHQVGADAQGVHGNERHQDRDRQHHRGHQRTAHVQQKDEADDGHDDQFLDQRSFQGVDGAVDEFGTVVHRLHRHALGQARGDFSDLAFDVRNDLQRVLAVTGHGDAGDHFALAVEFGHAAPFVGRQLDPGDVADQHRRAFVALDHQHLDVGLAAQVALAAHHVLRLGHLHGAPAYVTVGVPDDLRHLHQGNAVGAQLDRVDRDLVGLHEAADRGHFGHPVRLGQLVAHIPVLDRAQFGQRLVFRQQRVLVDPAHARGVRADLRGDPLGHAPGGEVEVLQHA